MKLNSRYLGAIVLAPLLIFVLLGGLPLKLFTIALSVCGLYEFYNALKTKEIKSIPIISYILLVIYYALNNDFDRRRVIAEYELIIMNSMYEVMQRVPFKIIYNPTLGI